MKKWRRLLALTTMVGLFILSIGTQALASTYNVITMGYSQYSDTWYGSGLGYYQGNDDGWVSQAKTLNTGDTFVVQGHLENYGDTTMVWDYQIGYDPNKVTFIGSFNALNYYAPPTNVTVTPEGSYVLLDYKWDPLAAWASGGYQQTFQWKGANGTTYNWAHLATPSGTMWAKTIMGGGLSDAAFTPVSLGRTTAVASQTDGSSALSSSSIKKAPPYKVGAQIDLPVIFKDGDHEVFRTTMKELQRNRAKIEAAVGFKF